MSQEKLKNVRRRFASYSSIGDSSGSSSSSDGDELQPKGKLLQHYSKRIFTDSTSNLLKLESTFLKNKNQTLDGDLEEIDLENPLYVDMVKIQFFTLGFASGAAIQMFCVSVLLMFVSYSQQSGPLLELSHEYYPVFRCMFFISFFFSLYGANLFIWRRYKIEYRSVLGVGSTHTYRKSYNYNYYSYIDI